MYNVGNTRYRMAEAAGQRDINAAIENYREAAKYYKRAMELEPEDVDAKINYEFVTRKIKEAEQQKQQQQNQEQNQEQQKDK